MEKIFVSKEMACELLSISAPYIEKFLKHNFIRHAKIGSKYLIRVDALDEFSKRLEGNEIDIKDIQHYGYLFLDKGSR
jgi:excisionase family DNA binding protein